MADAVFDIINKKGLHARAAAKFVRVVDEFTADIEVEKDGQSVSGFSIMGLLSLGASKGTQIAVRANGDDADAALAALGDLCARRFDEEE